MYYIEHSTLVFLMSNIQVGGLDGGIAQKVIYCYRYPGVSHLDSLTLWLLIFSVLNFRHAACVRLMYTEVISRLINSLEAHSLQLALEDGH